FIDDVNNIGRRRPQVYKDRPNYYDLTDDEFIYRFRLSKSCVNYLLNLLVRKLETATDRNMALAPLNQVLLTLRFYALETMLISVADMFGISVSSASRTIKNVSYAIAGLSSSFLKIPVQDIAEIKMKMFKIARFPLVFVQLIAHM
ncbi:putative nuclease HARBI1, partial [Acyrthosiphon pisum]|uniref:Nuclease HARBI1 n=1 Tax=Acyrthosiphon pisum TaxID=7029 RepID=A0A8R2BAF4_ACYPI